MIFSIDFSLCKLKMGICRGNLTIIIKTFRRDAILRLDREANALKGLAGIKLDGLLGKRTVRNCKLISTTEIGTQVAPDNGTFDGAFGMLQRKEGDWIMNHYSQYFKKDWFEHSPPSTDERCVTDYSPSL